jgi:hypothetical protein
MGHPDLHDLGLRLEQVGQPPKSESPPGPNLGVQDKSLIAWRRGFETSRPSAYTLNEDPQPQVLFTFGFSNLKPAPSRVST